MGFDDYSPSSGSSSSTSPMVPFGASLNTEPNVPPLSLLTLMTGVSLVWFVSHQVTTTLSPSESISTLEESKSVVLLKLILSPKVCPPSVDTLKFTSSLLLTVLLVHHATYMLSPVITTGAPLRLEGAYASFRGVTTIVAVPKRVVTARTAIPLIK